MSDSTQHITLEVDELPPAVRDALEALTVGESVMITRRGKSIGTLRFEPAIHHGVVLPEPLDGDAAAQTAAAHPERVMVVVTAMKLSKRARERLAEGFGPGYVVMDLNEAPPTADVLLTHPVSVQLLGSLRGMFPEAKVIITEIEDPDNAVNYVGPVGRLLDAGAAAYVPPRALAHVAMAVRNHLTPAGPAIQAGATSQPAALPDAPAVTDDAARPAIRLP